MRRIAIILLVLISLVLIFGCTSTNTEALNQGVKTNGLNSKWSEKVSVLGEPTYEKIIISKGYEILPFPGLTYSGIRDGYQSFYATNKDYTFAIYASPDIINAGKNYEEVKKEINKKYSVYSNLDCRDITTTNWLTQAQVFECRYYVSQINADYKSTIFYKDNKYVETILAVWGTKLGTYEYIYNEFNEKAVKWN